MTIDVPHKSSQGNILNYSVVSISSDEEENPLVLKLKISERNKVPLVVLKKVDDVNQYIVSPRSSTRSRKVKHFDGFEMDLPIAKSPKGVSNEALTPRKRGRSKKVDVDIEISSPIKMQRPQRTPRKNSDIDGLCTSITDRVKLTTPVKRSLSKESDVSPLKKRAVDKTPLRETPRRRGCREINNLSPLKLDENEFTEEHSPPKSVKVNLDESFRRIVLRSRQNIENIRQDSSVSDQDNENINSRQSNAGIRRSIRPSTRQSYAQYYYYDEAYAVEVTETLKKSEIEVPTAGGQRVLRSRSNSSVSSGSNILLSDDSFVDNTAPKSRKITRSKTISVRSNSSESMDVSPERANPKQTIPKTPKTPKNRRQTVTTPKSVQNTPKTPKNRLKMLRDGVITPSMHSRSSIVPGDSTPLMKARSQLHVSYVPTSLPCREKEYLDVYNFIKGKLEDSCGGCMYISGVPGTGKTATVTSVIDNLLHSKKIPKFSYVSINGMRLTEPRQSYVEIWKQLTGKTVPWEQAQGLLEDRFTKKKNLTPVVMLIDELDILCTKRQDVVYNLLDWPTKSKDQLIVITIANTMDLPERLLMSRVTSRLGLTRLTFQAYTHKQLMEIVTKRLIGTDSFNSDAVQLVARKVASVSGDARRALDICRRAAEIAEEEGKGQLVNIMHINEALTAMITQPQVTAIRRCSRLQKLLLQAIVAEIERTGVEETTFADVFRMLVSCCALDGFKMVSSTVAQRALCQLSACKLILTDQKCSDIYQRIILNVSVHDVYFALKKE